MPHVSNGSSATVAEREAELIALQNAFDEYIASSRELEEELDGELANMQEKLAESTAANAALAAQLENISPQLFSLETALSNSRQKLKDEQKLRRAAEQAQDEADQRVRELEQSLQTLQEECDEVHEELAFKESELEETRLELEVEKQQLENELAEVRSAWAAAEQKGKPSSSLDTTEETSTANGLSMDEGYVKKLEEELELVTEQLIDTEKRLAEAEAKVEEKENQICALQGRRGEEDEQLIVNLQNEKAELIESEEKLRQELTVVAGELGLSQEEVALQNEEMQNVENESRTLREALDKERASYKEEMQTLSIQLKDAQITSKASICEVAMLAETVKEANEQNEDLLEQVAALESALENAKADYQSVLNELDDVNARFDEAQAEAEQAGRDAAAEDLRSAMRTDAEHEINQIRESLNQLSTENASLQKKVDEAEMALAEARDNGNEKQGADSQVVVQLQAQLERAKDELTKKDQEMAALTASLEERLVAAEERVTHLETELHSAKGQLATAEAHLIVLRFEKERHNVPKSPRGRDPEDAAALDNAAQPSPSPSATSRARSSSPSSVMRLELRLAEEEKKCKTLEKDCNELQDQKRMGEVRIKRLEEDIKTLQKQLFANGGDAGVVTQMTRLSSLGNRSTDMLFTEEKTGAQSLDEVIGSRDVKRMAEELKMLETKFNSQREYNSQLLSKMLHLQGNIQVYCRIRPMSMSEVQNNRRSVVEALSETEVGCFDSRTNKWKSFTFDRVWGPDQSQTSVFQDVEPLALSVVDGFNACIFAYGQTGSGKTYTMEGALEDNQHGISYRTIQKIFHLLKLRAQQQKAAEMFVGTDEVKEEVSFSFSLKVGMLEIYNDEIYDLLSTTGATVEEKKENSMKAGGKASLDIRRNQDGRVEVPNLTKESVNSIEEVMELLKRGNSNRATAATDLNEHSSRSHMVLSVDVISGLGETHSNRGTLYLVDLAGSERVRKSNVAGDNLKEAGFINKSLSALGNVMEALDRKSSHVPFRDSKLTYLLQNALGGNSRTMMIVATCPIDLAFDESVYALQFATRVRRIQIGAAQRNVTSKNLEETVKTLTDELRAITRAKERTEGQLHSLKRDNTRVQEKLNNWSKARSQGRDDSKTLEVLRKNNDEMAARWQKEKASREETSEELEKARIELRATNQQLNRFKSKLNQLEQKLEDKEGALEKANDELLQARNKKSAATVRSRRSEVLGTRVRSHNSVIQPPSPSKTTMHRKLGSTPQSPGAVGEACGESDVDVSGIRSQVLALLEKHDKAKVDRIDIIMDKFKGKEALLLEKMTQRYEAGSNGSASSSIKTRNAMALQRHQERMRKIHEKRTQTSNDLET